MNAPLCGWGASRDAPQPCLHDRPLSRRVNTADGVFRDDAAEIAAIFAEPAQTFWLKQPEAGLRHNQISALKRVDQGVERIVTQDIEPRAVSR